MERRSTTINLEQMVNQFNETYKADSIRKEPTVPTASEMKAAGDIIIEELMELAIAHEKEDKVEMFDAFVDILYATAQQAHLYGFPIAEGLREVHRSNMSKLDKDGNPILREDGKVLKGENYSPPDLASILEKQVET